MIQFEEMPKIARLVRECSVQEKLDGTNSSVHILPVGQPRFAFVAWLERLLFGAVRPRIDPQAVWHNTEWQILAGSRTRFVTPSNDNQGFARWVRDHAEDLLKLGKGSHFGEWWGQGIGRKYGLKEKRFSLFNVARWSDPKARPACCHVVPQLYHGPFDTAAIDKAIDDLARNGSRAAPGFMKPEGIVVWHEAARVMFKRTVVADEKPKSAAQEAA